MWIQFLKGNNFENNEMKKKKKKMVGSKKNVKNEKYENLKK